VHNFFSQNNDNYEHKRRFLQSSSEKIAIFIHSNRLEQSGDKRNEDKKAINTQTDFFQHVVVVILLFSTFCADFVSILLLFIEF
jgi:hypothetical protein